MRTKIVVALLAGLVSACGLEEPGTAIENPSDYLGCYQLDQGEIISLSEDELRFDRSGQTFSGQFRRDKHGPFFMAQPGFLLSEEDLQPVVQDWPGVLVRLDEPGVEKIAFVTTAGESVIGSRVSC